MKKVSCLLLIATMLFSIGVTAKQSDKTSDYQVSKNDVSVEENPNFYLVGIPEFAMIQGDIYYIETVTHCDYYQENATEIIWTEVETPPPNSIS
jgi:hypothetical protein